ncbi:uncharacterized protein LOC107366024 [Tetranychus urticae]|uniref:Uncharacterized protein n=1 Tax=Tetranychus urticae TaxID=32264 RepID=T1KNT5_TETUR|nr:uncharacterized protein LOC107366024 [Tetranychus urticae]
MTGNNDSPSKVTIKLKITSDEDYQDVTIDWSDESCELKQLLLIRKIADSIGLPAQYIRFVSLNNTTDVFPLSNTESNFCATYSGPALVDHTFWQSINDGDCFYLRSFLGLINHECLFDLIVGLFSAEPEYIHPTECSRFYCQIINSRSWLDKKKEIILNSEIFPKIRAALPDEPWGIHGNGRLSTLVNFNIRQYFTPCCRCHTNSGKHERHYPPHRG